MNKETTFKIMFDTEELNKKINKYKDHPGYSELLKMINKMIKLYGKKGIDPSLIREWYNFVINLTPSDIKHILNKTHKKTVWKKYNDWEKYVKSAEILENFFETHSEHSQEKKYQRERQAK